MVKHFRLNRYVVPILLFPSPMCLKHVIPEIYVLPIPAWRGTDTFQYLLECIPAWLFYLFKTLLLSDHPVQSPNFDGDTASNHKVRGAFSFRSIKNIGSSLILTLNPLLRAQFIRIGFSAHCRVPLFPVRHSGRRLFPLAVLSGRCCLAYLAQAETDRRARPDGGSRVVARVRRGGPGACRSARVGIKARPLNGNDERQRKPLANPHARPMDTRTNVQRWSDRHFRVIHAAVFGDGVTVGHPGNVIADDAVEISTRCGNNSQRLRRQQRRLVDK